MFVQKTTPKILLDLERLRYPYSGIANVFRNLAKGFQTENREFDFTFFGVANEDLAQSNYLPWKKWHKFFENFSPHFDLIHVSHQLSSYFQRDYKTAVKIVTLHDLNFLHENLSEKKRKKMLAKVNANLKYADFIVCISAFAKKDFLENQHLFTCKKLKSIEVIHNGIELPAVRNYDFGRFAFLQDRAYFLNIGVLFEKKNQLALIEMLPYVKEDLVLVFSEEKQPYSQMIREKVTELKLDERVHFLQNVSEEEKYALIQNCRALCHPSLAEGFGIPPIEAMSFGKPVFLSTFTSLPEIGGPHAFYFTDFEPEKMAETVKLGFQKLKAHPEIPEKLCEWALQFKAEKMAIKYLDLYSSLLQDT